MISRTGSKLNPKSLAVQRPNGNPGAGVAGAPSSLTAVILGFCDPLGYLWPVAPCKGQGGRIARPSAQLNAATDNTMLGELRNIRTQTLVGMALAILDIEWSLNRQEITELDQIRRELQRRRHLGQVRVRPIMDEEQTVENEQVRTCGW